MVSNTIITIVSIWIFMACSSRPANVLSEDKMVKLMADMQIAESYTQQMASTNADKVELGKRVMAAHGVNAETVDTTLAWYGRNLDEYADLFEKVDKEINKRKNKYTENKVESFEDITDLWPYGKHMVLAQKDEGNALVFSILNPGIENGERINMGFALPNQNGGKGELGVEYDDGSGELVSINFNNKYHIDLNLQSDTLKLINRLYGIIWFKDNKKSPIYVDSISLTIQPIDTLEYQQKKRTQKRYSAMREKEKPKSREVTTDSVSSYGLDRK